MPILLQIEDEARLSRNIELYLTRAGWTVETVPDAETGLRRMPLLGPDVVLMDFNLPGMDGLAALRKLRERDPACRVVMMTGQSSVQLAVDAMKAGASDFISKPLVLADLKALLDRLAADLRAHNELSYLHARNAGGVNDIIGESDVIAGLRQRICLAVRQEPANGAVPPAILITGETGTGKELVARACHQESPRSSGPFIELNCAAIPMALIESELFGYERGAFTDARERKIGLLEAADGGTLFLDEAGEMDQVTQSKLLKVLDDFRVRRLGGIQDRQVNVRVIVATNRELELSVREGRFREDLFHRLSVVRIKVPPLRARPGDIGVLVRHFLQVFARRYAKPGLELSAQVLELLAAHAWPGNVRELRNVVEQAVLVSAGERITAEDLALQIISSPVATRIDGDAPLKHFAQLVEIERDMIRAALVESNWNVTQAAQTLGLSRDVLRYSIKRHGLQRPALPGG